MSNSNKKTLFWTSFSDLMTSMFFAMLVLFVVVVVAMGAANRNLQTSINELEEAKQKAEATAKQLEDAKNRAEATAEQLAQITKLSEQFETLTASSSLGYDAEKRMFYAKEFVGKEIFHSFTGSNWEEATIIKSEYLQTVDSVGVDLLTILKKLSSDNKNFKYLLVIEGTAGIPPEQKASGLYNPDSPAMYDLSYRRALALYNKWQHLNLRQYNTEIIIAGSGFNGINRDIKEDYNKRFVVQIIPKIDKPKN